MSSTYNPLESFDIELNNNNIKSDNLNSTNMSRKIKIDGRIFESFSFEVLGLFHDFLKDSSYIYEFKESWNYKPSHMSIELFNNPALFYIVFFLNNVYSARDFHIKNFKNGIIVPSAKGLQTISEALEEFKLTKSEPKILNTGEHVMYDQFLIN